MASTLTLLACPKPFRDSIAQAQRNAIGSWVRLSPRPEIILFGDEAGTAELCREMGLRHVPVLRRNAYGTPLFDDIVAQGEKSASHDWICYLNSDIILLSDFMQAFQTMRAWGRQWVLVGGRMDVDWSEPVAFDRPDWQEEMRRFVRAQGKPMIISSDYFLFRKNFYEKIPPFALGRGCFDNWLLWYARSRRVPLVDATAAVLAIHQNHWTPWGKSAGSPHHLERRQNVSFVGEWRASFVLGDATHALLPDGVRHRGFLPWKNRIKIAFGIAEGAARRLVRQWFPKK